MKTFEQIAKEHSFNGCSLDYVVRTLLEARDSEWREELGKDRGVKSFNDWWELNRINHRLFGDADSSVVAGAAWSDCESLWRHKCLNIEQASSMKIAILERELKEALDDIDWLTTKALGSVVHVTVREEIHKKRNEIRQRHKLDEVQV